MPRSGNQKSAADSTDKPEDPSLPTTDGTHLAMAQWLRELDSSAHLFESDISYFLATASAIASNCKTAVLSPEHSRLLLHGQVHAQNYGVLNPPAIANGFVASYAQVRTDVVLGALGSLTDREIPASAPTTLPDNHILSPCMIFVFTFTKVKVPRAGDGGNVARGPASGPDRT